MSLGAFQAAPLDMESTSELSKKKMILFNTPEVPLHQVSQLIPFDTI